MSIITPCQCIGLPSPSRISVAWSRTHTTWPSAPIKPVLAAPRVAGGGVQVVRGELDLTVVWVEDLHPHVLLIEPLVHRVAEQVLDLAVHVARAPVVVGHHLVHDRREVLEQRGVAGRGDLDGLLGLDALA